MSANNQSMSCINDLQFIPLHNSNQRYPFLARPPPPQKARPDIPLPPPPAPAATATDLTPPSPPLPRRRSKSFAHITAWAALVQPGSPAPRSPQRRPSTSSSRRPSITRLHRRPSIAHTRATDGSFINVAIDTAASSPKSLPRTATPSGQNFDLTAFGYASVFVHLPKTPSTPSPFLRRDTNQAVPPVPAPEVPVSASYSHIPIPPVPASPPPNKRTVKRFRSFGLLRPRSKSTSTNMPPSPTKKASSPAKSRFFSPVDVTKRKKAKYNYVRPPPPLANDLALLQFSEGGTLESHTQRIMEKQAKQAAGSYVGAASFGVGDVYRDGKGGVWWDADEELEYQPLIAAQQTMADEEMQWVKFTSESEDDKENEGIAGLAGVEERRGSVSTQDSDLDPKYLVEEQQPDDAILSRKVGMSVLSLPSRPRRAAKHLHKPEFLVDVAAFGPRSPRAFGFIPKSPIASTHKPKGKARRRPPPLKLASPASMHKKPVNPSPVDADRVRKDFIEDSFSPSPLSPASQPQLLQIPEASSSPLPSPLRPRLASKVNLAALRSVESLSVAGKMVKKPSVFNMRGIFGKKME